MSFKTKALSGLRKVGVKLSQKSPTIMVVAGTIGLIAAGVVAAKKSATELNAILEEHKQDAQKLRDIRDGKVVLESISTEEFAEKKYKKNLCTLYLRTGKKLVKVYGPALVLAILSVVSIFGGHKILTKRHLAAIAESYAVKETLNEYRKRVAGKIGEEAEELVFLNADKEIVTEEIKDPKTGEVKRESSEVLRGPATKGIYRYIVSRETMRPHAWYDFESRQAQYLQLSVAEIGNQWLEEDGDFILLRDIMRHNWKESYLRQHPEVFTDGWWTRNPYGEPLGVKPIEMKVKKISGPGEEAKYEVIFNAQGNIVEAMAMAEQEKREERFRFKRKPRGRLRPEFA